MTQMTRPRFLPDNFTLMLITVVIIASFLPATGQVAVGFGWLTNIAIALLFFLHGAKLSRESIIAGAGHWRLHLLVFGLTFVLFPLLGLALKPVLSPLIGKDLYMGMLYLCALPATVQSLFHADEDGPAAQRLLAATQAVSWRMGYQPAPDL
jgi:sodium/bile acid cotransporter 7